jgi:hypothetical protein
MGKCSVLFEVRTEFLNGSETSFGFTALQVFLEPSYALHTQEWFNLIRDDVLALAQVAVLISSVGFQLQLVRKRTYEMVLSACIFPFNY